MCDISELVVLVVDSDEHTQAELCNLLEEFGVKRLLCEKDDLSALDMLTAEGSYIDIVFASHDLGEGHNGTQFISKVKEMYPDKVCLMYSHEERGDSTDYLHALIVGSSAFFRLGETNFKQRLFKKLDTWVGIAMKQYDLSHGDCCG